MIVSLEWCPFSCIVNVVVAFHLPNVGVQYMSNKPPEKDSSKVIQTIHGQAVADELNLAISTSWNLVLGLLQ